MSNPIQNFYKSTITQDWSIGPGNFYVSVKPTTSVGRLVVSPSSDTLREIVEYTSTGTDGNGDYIVISARGVGGTTEQTHTVGEKVRMNITAEDWEDMRDDIDSIVAAGAPNASTVQKGIGELATPAQIDALTENGETGGPLLINPKQLGDAHNIPHVAPGTSGNILISNGTDWTSGNVSTVLTPAFQQEIVLTTNLSGLTAFQRFASGCNQTGTVFYIYFGDEQLTRFEKDTNSGMFIETHTINPTLSIPASDSGSIIVIGSYIYVFSNNGTNIVCSRFLGADLTGEQVMTVPTVSSTGFTTAWTDGTDAYLTCDNSQTTSRKWSVSGTTFSAVSTATIPSFSDSGGFSTFWDGSYAYVVRYNTSTYITIYKLTSIDATTTATTVKKIPMNFSDGYTSPIPINISSNLMYVGALYKNYNETNADATLSYNIRLIPISKP